ncbi:MAG: hypothetical protein ACJ76F_04305 [Bacteroidia bacterium]
MKSLPSFVLIILVLMSCSNQGGDKGAAEAAQAPSKMDFATAFKGVDTSKTGLTVACSSGQYKLISDKLVLHFKPYFPVQFDSSYTVAIDGINASQIVELLVYDNNKSSLSNFCSDVVVNSETSEPSRRLVAQQGNIIVGYSDPTELSGVKTSRITIYIKDMTFIDEKTGEKFELKNELLWKVLDIGTAG